jgi:hypothetical protein
MTTLKETITRELLDSLDDPSGLEAVLKRHSRSKGPLYLALAEATSQFSQCLFQTREDLSHLQATRDELQEGVESLDTRCRELEEKARSLDDQVNQAEGRLTGAQTLLDKAQHLEARGFGEEELARLYELLGQTAASHGLPPEQGVAQFFETVQDYEHLVSLELEAQSAQSRAEKAKAEAERWEAEARSKEAHTRARAATIDTVERLLGKGVKEGDFRQWERTINRAGVSAEALAGELERYGSLERLSKEREQRSEKLQVQMEQTEARLEALRKEQAKAQAAIGAVRDGALREMDETGRLARQHLDGLLTKLKEYGELQHAAETLKQELALAQAFKSLEPSEWERVPRWAIQRMMLGLVLWSKGAGRNRMVTPPEAVRQRSRSLMSWQQVSLVDITLWALAGVATEEEMRALVGGKSRPY